MPFVVNSFEHSSVTLYEFETIKKVGPLDGAVLLQAITTTQPQMTTVLTSTFLRDRLDLPLIGSMTSKLFPARCVLEKGIPVHPIRLYGNKNLIVCSCEFKLSNDAVHDVVSALIAFSKRHFIRLLVSVEGLPIEFSPEAGKKHENKLAFFSTDGAFAGHMDDLNHEKLEDSVIVGASGLSLAEAFLNGIPCACIIAPCNPTYPEASSAVLCVKALSSFLKDNYEMPEIDISPLEEKADGLSIAVNNVKRSDESNISGLYM